jgi:branched-chain amino acid aminotransferase
MQKTDLIWLNGSFVPWDEAKVHALTHTLHYGAGAFEGIRFYKTNKGPAIYRLDDHIERLFYSSETIGMTLPYSFDQLRQVIIDLVSINKLEEGYIRPLSFYGYGSVGVNPQNNPVEVMIACWPWGAYLPHDRVDIKTSKYIRVHPQSTVADAKICGHYINGILGTLELRGTHYHESLFLDYEGNIAEGAGENLFIVKDNIIYTPSLGNILAGITRQTVIDLTRNLGFEVVEKPITLKEAYNADEAFFTGTAAEITQVRSIDDNIIGKDESGVVSTQVKDFYHEMVRGNHKEYLSYLTIVPSTDSEKVEALKYRVNKMQSKL